jgi:hypothetical protein
MVLVFVTNDKSERYLVNRHRTKHQHVLPFLLNTMNRHRLLIFILANFKTGIINLSINTIHVTSEVVAIMIVMIYLIVISMVSTFIDMISFSIHHRIFHHHHHHHHQQQQTTTTTTTT